ncbi:MAG: hypothetical protein ABII74_03720 [Elusimicrobiota bacterium]
MKKLVSVIIANCLLFTTILPGYAYTKEKFYLRAPLSTDISKDIEISDSKILEEARKLVEGKGVEGAAYVDLAKGTGSETYIDQAAALFDQIIVKGGILAGQAKELKKKLWMDVIVKPIKTALGEYDMRFIAESKPTAANPKPRARKFTPKHAYEMACAIGTKHFNVGDTACVFGDARSSRDSLMKETIRGLQEQGVNVIYSNEIVPSPVVKWIADMFRIPSLQISGSHNPADENGIKIRLRVNGEGPVTELFGEQLFNTGNLVENRQYRSLLDKSVKLGSVVKIGELLDGQKLDEMYKAKPELRDFLRKLGGGVEPLSIDKNGQLVKGKKKEYGILALYKNMLVEEFGKNYQEYLSKGIVPYIYAETGNGVVGPVLEDVFKRIGLKEGKDFEFVKSKDGGDCRNPMGDPPVIADTLETEKYLRPLRDKLEEHYRKSKKPAIGIAFDGDGDRLEFVIYDPETGDGIPVTPERLMILGYRDYALKNAAEWIKNGEKMLVPVDVRGSSVVSEMLEKVAREVRDKYRQELDNDNFRKSALLKNIIDSILNSNPEISDAELKKEIDARISKFKIEGEYIPTGYPYNTKYAEGKGTITYKNVLFDENGNRTGEVEEVIVGKNIKGVQRVCPVNCEASGHAYWALMKGTERGDIPNDDALYSALYYTLMDTKMGNKEDEKYSSISDAVSPSKMKKYPVTPDLRLIAVQDSEKFKLSEEIALKIIPILIKKYHKKLKINNASGWRMDLEGGGFVLIRASNTSAKISFKTEMNTVEELLIINQELDELLRTYQEGEPPQITGNDWKNEIQKIFQTVIKEKNIVNLQVMLQKNSNLLSADLKDKIKTFLAGQNKSTEQLIVLAQSAVVYLDDNVSKIKEHIASRSKEQIEEHTIVPGEALDLVEKGEKLAEDLKDAIDKVEEIVNNKTLPESMDARGGTMSSRLFSIVTIPVVAILYARGFIINRSQLILSHASLEDPDPILDFVAGLKSEYPTMAPVYFGLVMLVLAVGSYVLYKVQTNDNFLKDFKPLKNLKKNLALSAQAL